MTRPNVIAIVVGALVAASPAHGQGNVEQIVARNVQPILPQNGKGGGVAVAVRMNGKTGMNSTALPSRRDLLGRTVQRYGVGGQPIARPGEKSGTSATIFS